MAGWVSNVSLPFTSLTLHFKKGGGGKSPNASRSKLDEVFRRTIAGLAKVLNAACAWRTA